MATSQTAVFRHVVGDHMGSPPVQVGHDAAAGEIVRQLRERRASAAVVLSQSGELIGIVTEQDIVRRLTGVEQSVASLMSSAVLTVRQDDLLYRAIGFMRRSRLRHMPVVDQSGVLVGLLELHEAMAVAAGPLVDDIDRLTHEDDLESLAEVKAAQIGLAERLLADGVAAPGLQALLADINNDIHRRVLDLLLGELGPPPVALMRGIATAGTLARIDDLESVAIMSRDDADRLRAAFAPLTGLQLRQQLADHRVDVPPGTFVDPRDLTGRELELVRSGLRAINDFRAGLRAELTGSLL